MDIITCPILDPLVPLFWISDDVSSGFQNQTGFFIHIANPLMISTVGRQFTTAAKWRQLLSNSKPWSGVGGMVTSCNTEYYTSCLNQLMNFQGLTLKKLYIYIVKEKTFQFIDLL